MIKKTRWHIVLLRFCLAMWAFFNSTAALAALAPWGSGESQAEDLVVSLLTFGPGDEVPAWFGHTALVVKDRRLNITRLYNYGMFSFDKKMLFKFAMGRLEFWVADAPVAPTVEAYRDANRDIREQELNLSPAQRLVLAKALAENVLPQNRDYLYNHYLDNCSTRPRDMIDRALSGELLRQTSKPASMTLREHTRRYTSVWPWMSVFLDFLMNDEIDQPIQIKDEAFLPLELEKQLAGVFLDEGEGHLAPLVIRTSHLYDSTRTPVPDQAPSYELFLLLMGVSAGVVALLLRRRNVYLGLYNVLVGIAFGLPGTLLFLMSIITDHTVTYWNENLFLASPLTLTAIPIGIALTRKKNWASRWLLRCWAGLAILGLVDVLAKVFPAFEQNNWNIIALILPVLLGMFVSAWLNHRVQKA